MDYRNYEEFYDDLVSDAATVNEILTHGRGMDWLRSLYPAAKYNWCRRAVKQIRGSLVDLADSDSSAKVEVEVEGNYGSFSSSSEKIKTVDELVAATKLDLDRFVVDKGRVSAWQTPVKLQNKRIVHIQNVGVKANFVEKELRPIGYEPIQPIQINPTSIKAKSESTALSDCVLTFGDSQNGYYRRPDGSLDPFHDRRAWMLCIELARRVKPKHGVILGDMADFPSLNGGRFILDMEVRGLMQVMLIELSWFLLQLVDASPFTKWVWIQGNHEFRLSRETLKVMPQIYGVRPVDLGRVMEHPVVSIPAMLNLDNLGIEWVGDGESRYPFNEYSLTDRLRFVHGDTTNLSKLFDNTVVTTVMGHIHKHEIQSRTVYDIPGESYRTIEAYSPGCMIRPDGPLPRVRKRNHWQQGAGLIWLAHGDPSIQHIKINHGRCVLGGEQIEAPEESAIWDQIKADTGLTDLGWYAEAA